MVCRVRSEARALPRGASYPGGRRCLDGSQYDPTSHYRAAAVFEFHQEQALTVAQLRAISRHQVSLLKTRFEALDADPHVAHVVAMPDERRGGFLAIRSRDASGLAAILATRALERRPTRSARLGPCRRISATAS